MTKFKRNSIIYTLSLILIVSLLAFSVALTCVKSTQNAYADYETDILNNPQAIVNFNQLQNFTPRANNLSGLNVQQYNNWCVSFNGTLTAVTGYRKVYDNIVNLYANHIYLFKLDSNYPVYLMNNASNTTIELLNNGMQFYTPNVDVNIYLGVYLVQNTSYNFYSGCYIIDLSQMFGFDSDNLTLQQCHDLFVSDYYPYNTGIALTNDTFTSYAQGVESVLQGMTTTIDTPTIIRTAQPYYGLYQNSKIVYYSMTGNYPETLLTDVFEFMNSAYVPFMTTLDSNVSLNISALGISDINIENFILAIYLLSSDNNLILVDTIQSDSIVTNYSLDIVIPTTCEGIVFSVLTEGRTTQYIGLTELKFTYKSNSLTNLLASANESGYNRAKTYYDDYYGEYGSGYQSIYDLGYSAGINAQATDFSNTYYTFPQFLGALFDVPVKVLTSLLDFDVFGFNLKNLVFSLITLAIVFAIVRLILMKTGDGK